MSNSKFLYHGTCTAFEPSIKTIGLVPKPENKYIRQDDSDSFVTAEYNAVYLTLKPNAHVFAQFRADWERAAIGDVVWFNGVQGKRKLAGKIIPTAKPLLVTVTEANIPIHRDPNSSVLPLYWTETAIAPSFLKFTLLRDRPNQIIMNPGNGLDGMTLEEYHQEYIREYL